MFKEFNLVCNLDLIKLTEDVEALQIYHVYFKKLLYQLITDNNYSHFF